jgi:hypothetical protein
MPTLEHNGLVELFRANPSIAPQFIESLFNMKVIHGLGQPSSGRLKDAIRRYAEGLLR